MSFANSWLNWRITLLSTLLCIFSWVWQKLRLRCVWRLALWSMTCALLFCLIVLLCLIVGEKLGEWLSMCLYMLLGNEICIVESGLVLLNVGRWLRLEQVLGLMKPYYGDWCLLDLLRPLFSSESFHSGCCRFALLPSLFWRSSWPPVCITGFYCYMPTSIWGCIALFGCYFRNSWKM